MHRSVLFAFVVCLAGVLEAQRPGAPTGVMTFDFGRVRQGETVSHEFKILNPREAGAARVVRVDLTGPGMTAQFKPDVGPGEYVSIKVTWNTSKVDGAVKADGIVRWADAKRSPALLTLAGYVVQPIELLPMGAAFFSAFTDERPEQVIRIVNHDQRPLLVKKIEVNGTHFAAKVQEVERGRRYDLRVTVAPGLAPGRFQERLTVHTDSPTRPTIDVPVNVFVKADVYANPEVVDFGDVAAASVRANPSLLRLTTQTFLLKRRQGPFQIKSASTDVPGLTVTVSPGNEAAHQVDVSLATNALTPRSLVGTIRLATSDARFPEIKVPVRGRIY